MAKEEEKSDSESMENSSSSEEDEESKKDEMDTVTEYEKQRLRRMRENNARMEAMGLRKMASKLIPNKQNQQKKKLKSKKNEKKWGKDDEDYVPANEENGVDDDDDESGSRSRKVKNNKKLQSKKKVSLQKLSSTLEFIDEDDELMQAIALSLKDTGASANVDCRTSNPSNTKEVIDSPNSGKNKNAQMQEVTRNKKRKNPATSRVQMTEDEVILHFFQFDEAGIGGIRLRDLERLSNTHDFTWTDSELDDMIRCFDSDGDGKLSLDDFRGIATRCNMIKKVENELPVGKA